MPGLGVARISRLAISIVLIALGVTQTAPVEVNAAGESWFNSSWQLRKSITIDATKVSSGTHTDFPVLINLSSDSSLAANAQADADDILFTSSGGATQLSHEIERYGGATGALVAWVKVPSLPQAPKPSSLCTTTMAPPPVSRTQQVFGVMVMRLYIT